METSDFTIFPFGTLCHQVVEVILIKDLPIDESVFVQHIALLGKGIQHLCGPLAELRGSLGVNLIPYSNNGRQRIELIAVGFPVIRSLCKRCTY